MKHLIRQVETYIIDSSNDEEANELIEQAKDSKEYELVKYTSEHKYKKSKGEIVDEWIKVVLTKDYVSEKDVI